MPALLNATTVPCELRGGMYDGSVGTVTLNGETPPAHLAFVNGQMIYRLDTRRRYKVTWTDDDGKQRTSRNGCRYVYDERSPIEAKLRAADQQAVDEYVREHGHAALAADSEDRERALREFERKHPHVRIPGRDR